MASTILLSDNGVTSGISGYQLTGGTDGTLTIQTTTSGGTPTTAMTIGTNQVVTFAQPPAGIDSFPSGTAMMFVQTSAPTGWTKSTSHNNKALRVVSGTASSGGTVAFTTAFASQAVSGTIGGTAITTAQMPAHNHGITDPGHAHSVYDPTHSHSSPLRAYLGGSPGGTNIGTGSQNVAINAAYTGISIYGAGTGISTNNNGSGATHDHTFTGTAIDLAVQYVDVIIATKD